MSPLIKLHYSIYPLKVKEPLHHYTTILNTKSLFLSLILRIIIIDFKTLIIQNKNKSIRFVLILILFDLFFHQSNIHLLLVYP